MAMLSSVPVTIILLLYTLLLLVQLPPHLRQPPWTRHQLLKLSLFLLLDRGRGADPELLVGRVRSTAAILRNCATHLRGASNRKAQHELNFRPRPFEPLQI